EIERCYEAGVRSFKMYMGYRSDPAARTRGSVGVPDGYIFDAMSRTARLPGALAMVHCENEELADSFAARATGEAWSFTDCADTRPSFIEAEAVQRMIFLADKASCPFYAVHVSSADALRVVHRARSSYSAPLFVETNLHHLVLARDDGASMSPS